MINLPLELTPSELLYYKTLPPFADKLLSNSRALRRQGRLSEAERCALDVMEASQKPGTTAGQAMALIHLADVHREMGKLGPALANCQKAHPIFQREPPRYQSHNEAVAGYALGLVHQLLGNEIDALKWYREADLVFERVKKTCWATINDVTQMETCTRIQRWMEAMSEYLTAVRIRTNANLGTGIWVPIILSDSGKPAFAVAELEIDKYIVERQLTVKGEAFRIQRLKGKRPTSLIPGVEYYALEIPDKAQASLGASAGDYALVERGKDLDQEGPGVLETLGGPEFGNFERDAGGNIHFVRSDATVIGGADLQAGYITALLKPA